MIAVVDYGMGNLRSVSKALESLKAAVSVSSDPAVIRKADKVILPGVGAFPAAMRELNARGLVAPVKEAIAQGKPYLGICLGLQLLFDHGEEGAGADGFGIIRGTVKKFQSDLSLKVPHMGWNQINSVQRSAGSVKECPLLKGISDKSFFYFVHSYYGEPSEASMIAAKTDYGVSFASMVWRKNVYATQFHPEKSQAVGLKLLDNFIKL